MLCIYSIDALVQRRSTTSSKHTVWLSWLAWLTGVRFVSITVRWRTGWISICLLTLTNKIWFFFLPSSEGARRKAGEKQVCQRNLRCSLYCLSSYAVRSSPTTCRGQCTSSWRWFLIISHVNYFSHHHLSSSPHPSKTNRAWWYFTVCVIGSGYVNLIWAYN